jgi:hypothetical protein
MLFVCFWCFMVRNGVGVGVDPVDMVELRGVTTDAGYISDVTVLQLFLLCCTVVVHTC